MYAVAPKEVDRVLGHLFRRAAGRIVASLTRRFGSHHLELAEEAVQEALMRALRTWPFSGIPDAPESWLFRVALNCGLDALRRETLGQEKVAEIITLAELSHARHSTPHSVDDELAMMFMCCHPALPYDSRIALALKTVGGLSVDEIAAAFLTEPTTIAQRLVRAKKQIRDQRLPVDVPAADELVERLSSVLDVLYLMFNEGYIAHGGENAIRADLCNEAIRLIRLVMSEPRTRMPHVQALLALMLFQAARLPARTTTAGEILLLDEQDPRLWNHAMTAEAFEHFEASFSGSKTAYHVEAAIAAFHAASPKPTDAQWRLLCILYDELMVFKPTPVAALNRAVALGMAQGPETGLKALAELGNEPSLSNYHLLPAACGAFWLKSGDMQKAAESYRDALNKPTTPPERRFLERQLARCDQGPAEPAT